MQSGQVKRINLRFPGHEEFERKIVKRLQAETAAELAALLPALLDRAFKGEL